MRKIHVKLAPSNNTKKKSAPGDKKYMGAPFSKCPDDTFGGGEEGVVPLMPSKIGSFT